MPTNAEIHAAIDLLIRQPKSSILTNDIADMLDDIVDNIGAGPGGTPGIDDVLAVGQVITADRLIDATGHTLTHTADSHTFNIGDGILQVNGTTKIIGANLTIEAAPNQGESNLKMRSVDNALWILTVSNAGALVITAD